MVRFKQSIKEVSVIDASSAKPLSTPRVWLVLGDKPGDNAQVEIVAEQLGVPYEIRRVLPKPKYVFGKPFYRRTLRHLDLKRSDSITPPWPDLMLTIGRRPSMAALWIQKQSGGHSRIVLFGRPRCRMKHLSLVITPPQYQIPEQAGVLKLGLPLMRSNRNAITEAVENWQGRFAELPRPITVLLVGGQTRPFRFDSAVARELLDSTAKAAANGFLYIATSRRTPPEVVATLKHHLPDNAELYDWVADDPANPYHALLGLGDRFVVTGDSMSMMVEVARLGKPLAIFPLPYQRGIAPHILRLLGRWLHGDTGRSFGSRLLRKLGKGLNSLGLVRYPRDLTAVHRTLFDQQLAAPLSQGFSKGGESARDELQNVAAQVRQILQSC